jgi:hypothetical protein
MAKRGRKPRLHSFENGGERKWCAGCASWLELPAFARRPKSWDGLMSRCHACSTAARKVWQTSKAGIDWDASLTKPCTICGDVKPLSAYRRKAGGKLGRMGQCKACSNKRLDGWRTRTRDRRLAYNREYYATEHGRQVTRRWQERNPVKRRVAYLFKQALERGQLVRPSACEWCGEKRKTEGHHPDYAKPLEVEWLCRKCHKAWHRQHGEGLNSGKALQSASV